MRAMCISCVIKNKKKTWACGLVYIHLLVYLLPIGSWAVPGGTAIPGQPVVRAEQAPDISPSIKNQFNIEVPQWGTYQILS